VPKVGGGRGGGQSRTAGGCPADCATAPLPHFALPPGWLAASLPPLGQSKPSHRIMKTKLTALLAAAAFALSGLTVAAQNPSAAATDMKSLMSKIQAKLKEDKKTAADLAPEMKEFDALLEKHKGEKTDDVAQILYMQAMLYSQVLDDETKSDELLAKLEKEFPDSKQAAMIKQQAAAKKVRAGLKAGAKFPDFQVKDLEGKPLSIANYKGKVVLIDFWATWCGPCVAELPNVLAAYDKYHKDGFEIIGISLDSDQTKLEKFIKDKKMTWPQFFDGKGWKNELGQKYGVNSIPATYLLNGEGIIIGENLRGEKLADAVGKALEKK
jgi:peroxiredoxin